MSNISEETIWEKEAELALRKMSIDIKTFSLELNEENIFPELGESPRNSRQKLCIKPDELFL